MSDDTLQPPSIEGFDDLELIGRGGMATVWRARQMALDRPVAIKILDPEQCQDDEDIDRFQSEARAAARMSHPGIIQVYDAFYRDGRFCFVMELVEGETVGTWLRRAGRLSVEEAMFVARGVAEALRYAWDRQSLVHLDVKPENVMVDASGAIKVMDFGLSRSRASLQSRREDGEDGGYVYGTPAYMPPEQATGEPDLGPQADMYALGATLYHLVSGRRLFSSVPTDEVMDAQVNAQDENIFDLDPSLPPFFCEFVERLLAKQPENRFPGWSEVLRALDLLEEGRPAPEGSIPDDAASTLRPSDALEKALVAARARDHRRPLVVRTVPIPRDAAPDPEGATPPRLRVLAGTTAAFAAADRSAAHRFRELLRRSTWKPSPAAALAVAAAALLWAVAFAAVSGRREADRRRAWDVRRAIETLAAVPAAQRASPGEAAEWLGALAAVPGFGDRHPELAKRVAETRAALEGAQRMHEALVLAAVEADAAPLAAAGDRTAAARAARGYAGPFAARTAARREALARRLAASR